VVSYATDERWAPDDLDDADPDQDAPRRRWGGAVLALLLMVLGAIGAVWLSSSDDQRQVDVVALARPLHRGQVVGTADLAVVQVAAAGGTVRLSTPTSAGRTLVGKPVLLDLPAGTLLTPEMVGSAALPPGSVSLGVQVAAAGLPSSSLHPGDVVDVVGVDRATGQAAVVVRRVQVGEVRPPAESGRAGDTVVYLIVPEQLAETVETAAASDRGVRLLGTGQGS
jgi:hypothetical protein